MRLAETSSSGARSLREVGAVRSRWWPVTLTGAAAFWSANLLVSLTPAAASYRSAMSIEYLPMLLEAAVGGLVVAGAVALVLLRHPHRVPGAGWVSKALLLAATALVLLTLVVEVPSKLRSGTGDPGHWLLVATVINAIRVVALGTAIGLAARAGAHPARPPTTQGGRR